VTKAGTRCTRKAATEGFCKTHLPKAKTPSLLEHAKTAGQIVTTVTGVITIIEKAVKLWQSLPFGPCPGMSDSYEYLVKEFGAGWSTQPNLYTPFNKAADDVNWDEAARIYDYVKNSLQSLTKVEDKADIVEYQNHLVAITDKVIHDFVKSLPSDFQERLMESIQKDGIPFNL